MQFKCRLLYINANTKMAGLSLQGNIIQNQATDFGDFSVGDVVDDVTVIRVDQGLGLLMKLSESVVGFTHVSLIGLFVRGFGQNSNPTKGVHQLRGCKR